MTSMTYQVTGMTCEHCVRAVTEEIETLAGVNSVTIALVPGGESAVTVTTDAPLTEGWRGTDGAGAYHLSGLGDEDGAIIAPARTLPLV